MTRYQMLYVKIDSYKVPSEDLLKYIRDGLAQGRSENVIRSMLTSSGWAQKDVDDAFLVVKGGVPASASIASLSDPTPGPLVGATTSSPASVKPKLFSFKGRIGRLRYFLGTLILRIIATIGAIIITILSFAGSIASIVLWMSSISSSTSPSADVDR